MDAWFEPLASKSDLSILARYLGLSEATTATGTLERTSVTSEVLLLLWKTGSLRWQLHRRP